MVELSRQLQDLGGSPIAVVALGAYGRRELTPHTEIELLFVSADEPEDVGFSSRWLTEAICYPLWERHLRVEPTVCRLAACVADARHSWSATARLLDARAIAGDPSTFLELSRQVIQPWRRDRGRLLHRLRTVTQRRHAGHASATTSSAPDLQAGRGGLQDLQALRWLEAHRTDRLSRALDFLLRSIAAVEELSPAGQLPHRLSSRTQERLARGGATEFLAELYHHTRWVAFCLDNALAPARDDRALGHNLWLRRGELGAERLPPLERAPAIGLRVANLIGLAPPGAALVAWASASGPPIEWDEATLDQWWLLLRAADWRAWDFLDATGLMVRYLPELRSIWRQPGAAGAPGLALDSHSFLALRRLHEWLDSDDPLAQRAWRALRHRDWLYLAVLVHELSPEAAGRLAERIGLPEEASATLRFVSATYQLLAETAARRDLYDEDMLLELATRVRTRHNLRMLFLVAAAHDLATEPQGWTPWKADLMRQLFGLLDIALRRPTTGGGDGLRSVEPHRLRLARALEQRGLQSLLPLVARLPRPYLLKRSPAFIVRHLRLLAGQPPGEGEVRLQAHRHRQPGLWVLQVVARDRPGLLATVAGVLALRGASVLAADATTTADGLVLDVFTVSSGHGAAFDAQRWTQVAGDVQSALDGGIPLRDLLGARPMPPEEAEMVQVAIDNAVSQFFTVLEVRAPDQVGLLYRITDGLRELGLDIHQARIATHPEGALDVFYVRDLGGEKLDQLRAHAAARALTDRLRGVAAEAP